MRRLFPLTLLMLSLNARAESPSVEIEALYDQLAESIANPTQFIETLGGANKYAIAMDPAIIATDVLWNNSFEASDDSYRDITALVDSLDIDTFSLGDKIRLYMVARKFARSSAQIKNLRIAIASQIDQNLLDKRSIIIAYSHRDFLQSEFGNKRLQTAFAAHSQDLDDIKAVDDGFQAKTKTQIHDLAYVNLDLTNLLQGKYLNKPKVLMFCRHNRDYPCRYIIKDHKNVIERNIDGSIWTQPSLGQSAHGLRYNVEGGNTPSGVFTIDSVMPNPDKQPSFGRFRRFILNFVPASSSEAQLKMAIPPSLIANNWWKESVVARDAGRNSLRIHGTGKHNNDQGTTFYPHVKTSGCVSQLEGQYPNKIYKDQRNLLDMFMTALGLQPTYSNERAIKGLLYVIEVDDIHRPVLATDIDSWLAGS